MRAQNRHRYFFVLSFTPYRIRGCSQTQQVRTKSRVGSRDGLNILIITDSTAKLGLTTYKRPPAFVYLVVRIGNVGEKVRKQERVVLARQLKPMLCKQRYQPRCTPKVRGADRQSPLRPLHTLAELDQTLVSFLRHHVQVVERGGVAVLEPRQQALLHHSVLVGGTVQVLRRGLQVPSPLEVVVDDCIEFLQGEGFRVVYPETARTCSPPRACWAEGGFCQKKVSCAERT